MSQDSAATPEQMSDSITGTSDDQRFAGVSDALKKVLRDMDAASGPATDDDLLQVQMFIAAAASGKFAEWPQLRWASGRILHELRSLRQQLATRDAAIEALRTAISGCPRFDLKDDSSFSDGVQTAFKIALEEFDIARSAFSPQPSPSPDAKGSEDSQRLERQRRVADWCAKAFGVEHANSIEQRAVRFLKEAIELYQACGTQCTLDLGSKLMGHVFSRPSGTVNQELGGVGVTILALAQAAGLDADEEEAREVGRVLSKPLKHFFERNKAKNLAGFNLTHPQEPPK